MKNLILLTFFIFSVAFTKAQSVEGHGDAHAYEQAVGLRGGFGGGITYKQQLGNDANYGEAIINFWDKLLTVRGLYERTQTTNTDGLRWYYGAGPVLGVGSEFNVGIGGVIGLEFTFFDIPINASLDLSPTFYLFQSEDERNPFDWQVGGFSLRYILR